MRVRTLMRYTFHTSSNQTFSRTFLRVCTGANGVGSERVQSRYGLPKRYNQVSYPHDISHKKLFPQINPIDVDAIAGGTQMHVCLFVCCLFNDVFDVCLYIVKIACTIETPIK